MSDNCSSGISSSDTLPATGAQWGLLTIILTVGLLCASAHTFARPGSRTKAARNHVKIAKRLYKAGKYALALIEFKKAQNLSPSLRTVANIGLCHHKLGHHVQALKHLEDYVRRGRGKAPIRKLRFARRIIQDILRSSTEVLILVNTTGASIYIDRKLVGSSPLKAAVRLSNGLHRIRVTHPDRAAVNGVFEVGPGRSRRVTIKLRYRATRAYEHPDDSPRPRTDPIPPPFSAPSSTAPPPPSPPRAGRESQQTKRRFNIKLGFATGFGYLKTDMEGTEGYNPDKGFASGPFGCLLDGGYFVADRHLLSLAFKLAATLSGVSTTKINWWALVRYRAYLYKKLLRVYLGGEVGAAAVFHNMELDPDDFEDPKDTVEHGLGVFGALAGFELVFRFIGLYLELEFVGLFPEQSVFHLGLSIGMVIEL